MNVRRHAWAESHDPETVPLMLNLHRAQALALSRAKAVWARHGLTSAEFDVLATLRNAAPPCELTPTQLQAAVLITSGGLTKVMRQLEAKELVTRPTRQPLDQRVKPVKLTQAGKRAVEAAMEELASTSGSWIRSILQPPDIRLMRELLGRIVEAGARDGEGDGAAIRGRSA